MPIERALEIEKTPLWLEFVKVQTQCDQRGQYMVEALFLLNDKGDTYTPLTVELWSIQRDYVGAFGDETTLVCSIPLGKYAFKIFPNRDHLRVTLIKRYLIENTTKINPLIPPEDETFDATLIEEGTSAREFQGKESKEEAALDIQEIRSVKFQLNGATDKRIRRVSIGGIYREFTVKELLRTVITREIMGLKIDPKLKLSGMDIVEPGNQIRHEYLSIPQGTKITDLAGFVQDRLGVYNAGLGSYIQGKWWYLFPLYDTKRFNKVKKTLTIVMLPKRKFPEIERTYRRNGDSAVVLTHSEADFQFDNDINYLNEGNGARYADADRILETDQFGKTGGNKLILNRRENNNEFGSDYLQEKKTYAPVAQGRISSNSFKYFSNLASRKGGLLRIHWLNSDPVLIEPGQVTRLIFSDRDVIREAYGTVLAVNHVTTKIGDMNTRKHATNSLLYLFVNLKERNEITESPNSSVDFSAMMSLFSR